MAAIKPVRGAGLTESIVHAPKGSAYAYRTGLGMIPSAEFYVFFDDFNQFVVGTAITNGPVAQTPISWQSASVSTGATLTYATTAALGATGGVTIASDGTSEGVAAWLPKAVQLTAAKKFFMEVRVQTSKAAETSVQFGLSDLTVTTAPTDIYTTSAANLVAYGTLAGSATLKMLADKSNSGTTAQTGTYTLSDTTWATLAIAYDGAKLYGYKDGQLDLTWSSAATTIPTGVALAPFIAGLTGATAANTVTFDYIRYVIER